METGRRRLAQLMAYWLRLSGLSARNLELVTDWAVGQSGWLGNDKISRVKGAKQDRGAGIRQLVAMGQLNTALWVCDTQGIQAAVARYGPFSQWGVHEEWLKGCRWLPAGDDPSHPLQFIDFAEVMIGVLELPYLAGIELPPAPPDHLSVALSDILNAAIMARGLTPRDGLRELLEAYPAKQRTRRTQLQDLILGATSWDRDQIEAELCAVAEALRLMRGLPVGGYGPGHLARELSEALPPSA
ncbi:MAG: hypothetical protein EBT27_08625 [Betaproteobacteria bacterium]|jgi:hypothetical protein|nr:hypothetical protein [Betaproteobacteria bacterium]